MNWFDYFSYKDGQLYWEVQLSSRGVKGRAAGNCHKQTGYVRVGVNGKQQLAHRVIWEMYNGPIPIGMQVDHINGNRCDNRLENLRVVTSQQNKWNLLKCKGWVYVDGKYQARIKLNRKIIVLGYFSTPEEASACYWGEKQKYHPMA